MHTPPHAASAGAERDNAEAQRQYSLGTTFGSLGQLDAAAVCFAASLACRPDFLEARHDLGLVRLRQGQPDAAAACFLAVIAERPDLAEAHSNLGHALALQGRTEAAVACYRTAITRRPALADAHAGLARLLARQRQFETASASYAAVLRLLPDRADLHFEHAAVLHQLRRHDEAAECYRQSISCRPDFAEAYNNLGNVLREQGKLADAAGCYRRATEIRPGFCEAENNLGNAMRERGMQTEAIACYRRVIERKPDLAEAHYNLGNALRDQGWEGDAAWQRHRLGEAADAFRRAIALRPDYAQAHNNLAMALLARGELEQGWAEYEWRWSAPEMMRTRRNFAQPQWRGERAAGQRLLIHAEQGFGDTLQFCRYARIAQARGLRVVMEVQAPLVRLLRTLQAADFVLARGEKLPEFDLHCPMLSLPLAHGTTLATIPSEHAYLRADPILQAAWRQRLAPLHAGVPRIGLSWAGNASGRLDRFRSVPPGLLAPLFAMPGLHWVSLQKGPASRPEGAPLTDLMGAVEDFADTAALIGHLDLVIAVDSAVAHLAAALGKPVWLLDRLGPCWRWLTGRTDSPWYPSLRIYRQPRQGDWDGAVAAVAQDLRAFVPDPA